MDRRRFLHGAIAGAGAAAIGSLAMAEDYPQTLKLPEKGELLLQTDRPPNLEMPLRYLTHDLTPNDAFYVRWHLASLPTKVDTKTFRLQLGGHVNTPLSLSLNDLREQFEPVTLVAVNQCSGNSRSSFNPRVPGVQWGNGAIGNARWTGVRLSDLLAKSGLKAGAVEISFNGLDGPVLPSTGKFVGTPDFIKSLSVDHANDREVMVAYAMNDAPLPMLNGYPLRLVVPGWYATYWVKALNEITVLDKPFDGFWMAKAYRVPSTPDYQEQPGALAKETAPISRMTVRSLFATPEPGQSLEAGKALEVQGVALDGGSGIQKVELSTDAGQSWHAADLGPDLGKYSWRRWRAQWTPAAGKHRVMVRATSVAGEQQIEKQWNRSGYARKVIESVDVTAA